MGMSLTAGRVRRTASRLVRHALLKSGFEIRRARRAPDLATAPLPSAGRVVEFMGPSGVGKTETLRRAEPALKDRWFLQEDIGFFLDEAFAAPPARQAFYERLARRRLAEAFAQSRHLAERSRRAAYLLSVLNTELAMVARDYPRGFFVHDGLSHNFASVLREMLREGDRQAEDLVRSRSYVFILAEEAETVVRNILKRREARPGFRTNNFPTLSPSDLETMSRRTDRAARDLAKRFEDLSANVLVLSAEDGWDRNCERILKFEQEILASSACPGEGRRCAAVTALENPGAAGSAGGRQHGPAAVRSGTT